MITNPSVVFVPCCFYVYALVSSLSLLFYYIRINQFSINLADCALALETYVENSIDFHYDAQHHLGNAQSQMEY